ncbi:hypothetical protein G4H71_16060 [Rhodococcus triatomae]|uniref:hypothetical protein n=1 Tax=Rhodococcus triatomae TaxID=300028 RepID=UPI00093500B8|nr:hypothetical protein [Rhodococcus triatomae]QNG21448.1 hypothetical protein G4H72_14315 [Rhodococcus triatomae]QNG25812.1 hypothetical protein G4H71_16060 [Rhodococcus triatomae]
MAAVIAAVAAAWFGFLWVSAIFGDRSTADTRDDAMNGARQAAINLNSFDVAQIDQSFENMRSSITGDQMNTDLDETVEMYEAQIAQAAEDQISAERSEAEPLHSTLTEFNEDDGTATALVVVAVRTTWPDHFERTRVTMRLGLQEVDGVWKASTVEPVGVPTQLEVGEVPGAAPAPEGGQPAPAPGDPAELAPVPLPGDSGEGQNPEGGQ